MDKDKVLSELNQFLQAKGLSGTEAQMDPSTRLREYGLPALAATKGILQDIQTYRPPTGSGLARQVKNKIITVIKNVTISTLELVVIRQNKFNELSYQFIELLLKENAELRERIAKLEKHD